MECEWHKEGDCHYCPNCHSFNDEDDDGLMDGDENENNDEDIYIEDRLEDIRTLGL